jgi:hypothetical protein
MSLAQRLKRVFQLDLSSCEGCDRVALQRFQPGVLARLPAQVAAFGIPHQQSPPL